MIKRYDPEIDPYSSGCSPYATMEECSYGEYIDRDELLDFLKLHNPDDCSGWDRAFTFLTEELSKSG